jgi:hypothetical protein
MTDETRQIAQELNAVLRALDEWQLQGAAYPEHGEVQAGLIGAALRLSGGVLSEMGLSGE